MAPPRPARQNLRLDALRENRVDLLARKTTWTLTRDVGHGMTFAGTIYYDGQTARRLEVPPGWSYRAIKAVRNYGEMFGRNLGSQSPLKIQRGLNALWRDEGILYAAPTR
jgi:hypothetical protein